MNTTHKQEFENVFVSFKDAKLVSPRGQLIKELENFSYQFSPNVRFMNFKSRKFKIDYVKTEFLWYLRGDRFDTSICEHAKMWTHLVNDDGSINSNYGQYIFGEQNQFDNVVRTLIFDRDSRRASIMILNSEHLRSNTKDVPCTLSLNFRIREDMLNMSVVMRSQDAVFGMTNDLPAFSFIHEMVFWELRKYYPELEQGNYHHHCNSFHVYERHFELLDKILAGDEFEQVQCPVMNGHREVRYLRGCDYTNVPEEFKFTKWLTTFSSGATTTKN